MNTEQSLIDFTAPPPVVVQTNPPVNKSKVIDERLREVLIFSDSFSPVTPLDVAGIKEAVLQTGGWGVFIPQSGEGMLPLHERFRGIMNQIYGVKEVSISSSIAPEGFGSILAMAHHVEKAWPFGRRAFRMVTWSKNYQRPDVVRTMEDYRTILLVPPGETFDFTPNQNTLIVHVPINI